MSFVLEAGTSAGLVGPSGGGKSTVMVLQMQSQKKLRVETS